MRDRRDSPRVEATPLPRIELGGYGVRDGIRSASFIKIVASILISNMLNQSLAIHLLPILTWDGVPRDTGVWILGSLAISTVLYIEVIFILVNGGLFWLIFKERRPGQLTSAQIQALSAHWSGKRGR